LQKQPLIAVLQSSHDYRLGRLSHELDNRLGKDNKLMRSIANKAKSNPKRVVFTEADTLQNIKSCSGCKR
jgi:hypothetical protein